MPFKREYLSARNIRTDRARCVICSCRRDMTWWRTLESHEKRMTTSTVGLRGFRRVTQGAGIRFYEILAGSYRMETISVRPLITSSSLFLYLAVWWQIRLFGAWYGWCIGMSRHAELQDRQQSIAIQKDDGYWWLLFGCGGFTGCIYVVTWPLSCASRNVLGWIYSHVWLCMTVQALELGLAWMPASQECSVGFLHMGLLVYCIC